MKLSAHSFACKECYVTVENYSDRQFSFRLWLWCPGPVVVAFTENGLTMIRIVIHTCESTPVAKT